MRLYRDWNSLPVAARGAVAAIGNFDGVHRGHAAVIGEAVARARQAGRPAAIVTFEPHPRRFFKPDLPPFLLASPHLKIDALRDLGVDLCFVLRFDKRLSSMTADAFAGEVLAKGLGLACVVAGYDFVFGKGRGGNAQTLIADMRAHGADAAIVPAARDDSGGELLVFSSTAVREALKGGDPKTAARILGRPFAIDGRVRKGDQRGRTIGFPTANIALGPYMPPKLGVYAVRVKGAAAAPVNGVANIGIRPTAGGDPAPRLEAHLFDFAGDLYGKRLIVELIEFVRAERKFDSFDALKTQIARDAETARAILAGA